jgi:hypothetical protein
MKRIGHAMRPKRRGLGLARAMAAAIAVIALGAVGPIPAAACVGMYLAGDPHLDQMADVIFSGTAVRENQFGRASEWTFVVDGVEKGSVGDRATVSAWHEESMCATRFTLGVRYRVLAGRDGFPPQLTVSSVGGTTALGPPLNPTPVEGVFAGPAWLIPATTVGAALLVGVAISFALLRRRDRTAPA